MHNHSKALVGLLLAIFGVNIPVRADITCNGNDGKIVLVLHLEAEEQKPASATRTIIATIRGDIPFDLAKAFPKVEVQMDDSTIEVEQPAVALGNDANPYDLEISIDRTTGMGRFSAVDNRTQQSPCLECENGYDINCLGLGH